MVFLGEREGYISLQKHPENIDRIYEISSANGACDCNESLSYEPFSILAAV